MPRCARSATSLVWGIPVHPTHLLRAIKTHERLLPTTRTLRGCHLFAPDPPQEVPYISPSEFAVATPSAPFATAALDLLTHRITTAQYQEPSFSFTPVVPTKYPLLTESTSSGPVTPAMPLVVVPGGEPASSRKGIASLPAEILDLIETEVRLSAHEEDVPRTLVDAINGAVLRQGEQSPNLPGWRRICVCGERYEETLDVMRCREKVMAEVGGRETQKYLLKYFGLTTAVISTPLKHSIVLLILPPKVSTLLAPLTTIPSLPMHPPIPKQVLASYPRDTPGLTRGRLPLSKSYLRRFSTLPPSVIPLITPSDDFIGHLHPGMFAQNHWRLRNQNSGMRASVVDPAYLLLTEEMVRRVRWCVEGLVLWKAVRVAREELGYEELACIEHFDMAQLVRTSQSEGLGDDEGEGGDGNEMLQSLRHEMGEARGKRVKVEDDTEGHTAREREKNYWGTAIRPSLWLLEELTYEP